MKALSILLALVALVVSPRATGQATAQPARASAPLACLIDASAVAEVGTPVIGVIDAVLVERGDLVRRGQVIAQHESRVERAAVMLAQTRVEQGAEMQAAQSQSEFTRKRAQRTAELTELNFVSNQAREQAETEASIARTRLAQVEEQRALAVKELDLARAQLAQRTVISPLNGVVVERHVSPGERVENRPLFKIAQLNPLRVEVVLPSALFGSVKAGSRAWVRPELPGAAPREATVTIVDRVIDAASNTFRARLTLPNADHALPSGLRCKIEFAS
jgi:RND family efflux transporter MFP subunit